MQLALPDDFRVSLQIHNGMRNSYCDVHRFFNYEALLSTHTIPLVWQSMQRLFGGEDRLAGCPITRTRKIKNAAWWNPAWVPITDADGDGFVMDLDPGPTGIAGQMFYFYHDGARPRRVAANSYITWLGGIARKLRSNKFSVRDGSIWLDSP